MRGIFMMTGKGVGYVNIPGRTQDIEIPPGDTGLALHGDTVDITVSKRAHGRERGEVVKVVERKESNFVGSAELYEGELICVPDNRKIHVRFRLPKNAAKPGYKILVHLERWQNPQAEPEASVVKVLGRKGEHETEMQAILLSHGRPEDFPKDVLAEAKKIQQTAVQDMEMEIKNRRDFRSVPTFTIDPADAKDFDDALSVKKTAKGFEIGVHIADVAHYMHPRTALDREAKERGVSIYLVDRTVPMLPEALSNDLCSLNPREDKLAFSAIFELNPKGEVLARWFGRTVIRSDKRFTYEEAQATLNAGVGPFLEELSVLNRFAEMMRGKRFAHGALDFEEDEVKVELDERGVPVRIFRKQRLAAHKLVEEWMLLANRAVAEEIQKKRGRVMPFIYRVHDRPDHEKIQELAVFVRALGHTLPLSRGTVKATDLNALFMQIKGQAEEGLIKTAALRSMAKAVYTTKNIGHFGLGFQHYTHFTSPIRRYPDVMVHRLLAEYLSGKKIAEKELENYEKIAIQNTRSEINAAEAERESVKLKQMEFMLGHVGQIFNGVITGVTEWGFYVAEKDTGSEGLVRMSSLNDDYYRLDPKAYAVVGTRSGRRFALGDEVRVRVGDVDTERKTLDWELV